MKLLVMCEGPNELAIVKILLENNALKFGEDDLLGLVPYHARQIGKSVQVQSELRLYPGSDIVVMRIGDTQRDALRIPNDYKERILRVEKYCTKPELEMLLIIAEGLFDDYEKVKSSLSPKEFAKARIKLGKKRYDNTSEFYQEYFSDCDRLTSAILEYRRLHSSHAKDELYLADLLR